ncbi:hypothetical protein IIA95_01380 [Patescibacteria group bacterium]|nr:hypothetical protein [Patescibacteria group bacterium]
MEWIILFFIGLGLYLFFTLRVGKYKFWKLVGRNPEEAYRYFKNHPEAWMVLDTNQIKDISKHLRNKNPEYKEKWVGPYRLYVPSIGGDIQIYGKKDLYEKEQDKLISLFMDKEKEVLK